MNDVAALEPQTEAGREMLKWSDRQDLWIAERLPSEIGALREALGELLWWSEFMQDPDWAKKDVADTDEKAAQRLSFMETFKDHQKRAEWLRTVLLSVDM